MGHEQTFGDTTKKVRYWGLSGRNRWESGHRNSKVCCWGQSGRTGDMAGESVVSHKQTQDSLSGRAWPPAQTEVAVAREPSFL